MASLFELNKTRIRLLDPGAGVGMLLAAIVERLLQRRAKLTIHIDAVEMDRNVLPYLEAVLTECQRECRSKKHQFTYSIACEDFILKYGPIIEADTSRSQMIDYEPYDYVISNPPYSKLSGESDQAKAMQLIVSGQPNIYPFFMAVALKLLGKDGQLVFITPRSFCSGLYYKAFRRWLLEEAVIEHIHMFESRKHIFDHDGVLQENIILKAVPKKSGNKQRAVTVSTSFNRSFDGLRQHQVGRGNVIHDMRHDAALIAIPTNRKQISIQRYVNKWHDTLHDLGLEISTGPVVAFRSKQYLKSNPNGSTAPLLWMHNMRGMWVEWEASKVGKEQAIQVSDKTKAVLLPVKNYVLLKRFSSKEQNRRLYASALLTRHTEHDFIGIENHLNYIYRPDGELTEDETIGMAALLNSSIMDMAFRIINGNTQVNASDIRVMPFPPLEKISEIANIVKIKGMEPGDELDRAVARVLGEEDKIMSMIRRR